MEIVLLLRTRSVHHPMPVCLSKGSQLHTQCVTHCVGHVWVQIIKDPPLNGQCRLIIQGGIDFGAGMIQWLSAVIWDTRPFHVSALSILPWRGRDCSHRRVGSCPHIEGEREETR